MPSITLDHLVVPVDSVERAAREWRTAGHDVRPGGRHQGVPTENALVPVADGTYVELLGPVNATLRPRLRRLWRARRWQRVAARRSPVAARFLRVLASPAGCADFCLAATPLGEFARTARAAGLALPDLPAMGRVGPDGQRLAWTLALPAHPALPFAIEDRTARALRVPSVSPAHPGLTLVRTRRLDAGVPDLAEATTLFATWLSRSPIERSPEVVFALDDGCQVRLVDTGRDGAVGLLGAEYDARESGRPVTWHLDRSPGHDNS